MMGYSISADRTFVKSEIECNLLINCKLTCFRDILCINVLNWVTQNLYR